MKKMKKFKKGAASFYIVAISTLILVIIAASFAAVIISEVTRTSNDDLAQSAYDSALAGVEDAKLAYYNYQSCLENNVEGCSEIIAWFDAANDPNNTENKCDMVAKILGREYTDNGVLVQEEIGGAGNNMQQLYTCAVVKTVLPDLRETLTSGSPTKVLRAKFDDDVSVNNSKANSIKAIRVSWQGDKSTTTALYSDFGKDGIFSTDAPLPPVLSVGLIQTAETFNLSDFDMTQSIDGKRTTDRGTVYLVPVGESNVVNAKEIAANGSEGKYLGAWNGEYNEIDSEGFLKSNDKTTTNLPYVIYCNGDEFACSATIELPSPVNGNRSGETFMIALSMPYAESSTDVRLEFCGSESCFNVADDEEVTGEIESTVVPTKNVQISIDSTGRANDLYRRVETYLDTADTTNPYPLYAIQLLGGSGDSLAKKNLSPTCEWNFAASATCQK